MSSYDILIKNGWIIDGSGNHGFQGDMGIVGGKISEIRPTITRDAIEVIDAKGLIVSPGFIDAHAHFDSFVFRDPMNMSKLKQGVTTEISGHCGESMAPVCDKYFEDILKYYEYYYPPACMNEFKNFKTYFDSVSQLQPGINLAFLIGHGSVRMTAMGFEFRRPSRKEMDHMKLLVREGMEAGALGLSTGLLYPPGSFTETDELITLCQVVKEYDGIYSTHLRNEGDYLLEAVAEAIEVGRQTGVPVVISHHKSLGKKNWGKTAESLQLISKAREEEGLEIFLDQYPYDFSCTTLSSVFPPSYVGGGFRDLMSRLHDPVVVSNLKNDIFNPKENWDNAIVNVGYDGIYILVAENTPDANEKTISQYADEVRKDPFEATLTLLIENEFNVLAAFKSMSESDIERVMAYPYTMIGSDGIPVLPGKKTHPRLTGAFPRVLGSYVRDKGILALEEAVRKMTSLPARTYGLKGKGVLKEGYDADVVIFDSQEIRDTADLDDPFAENCGIHAVVVNGRIALKKDLITKCRSGRLLLSRNRKTELSNTKSN